MSEIFSVFVNVIREARKIFKKKLLAISSKPYAFLKGLIVNS
jgi:hypothetical protein